MHSLQNVQEKTQRSEGMLISVRLSADHRMFQLENSWTHSDAVLKRLAQR
jgi:hypothetical protein